MKQIYFFISIVFLILGSCNSSNSYSDLNEKTNVLFIMTDDLNCDLGSYNHDQVISPNIDKLAEDGFLFENAHIQWPQCGQSRASFMTGLYSDQTKHTKLNVDIRTTIPDVITLGQRFRQRGYKSVRIGKIYHYDNPGSIGTSSYQKLNLKKQIYQVIQTIVIQLILMAVTRKKNIKLKLLKQDSTVGH